MTLGNVIGILPGAGRARPLPSTLPNLFAWFRKGVGQVNNSGLDSWADQSGGGRHLATVTGSKGTVNGDGTVTWAANGMIDTATWTQWTSGMLYARMRVDQRDATDQRAMLTFNTASFDACVAYRSTGIANAQIILKASIAVYPSGHDGSTNNPDLVGLWVSFAYRFNGASTLAKESGGVATSPFAAPALPTSLRLGSNHTDNARGYVTFAELALFNNVVHDDATMDAMLAYMDTR